MGEWSSDCELSLQTKLLTFLKRPRNRINALSWEWDTTESSPGHNNKTIFILAYNILYSSVYTYYVSLCCGCYRVVIYPVSHMTHSCSSVLESFPTILSPLLHRPLEGQPLNLSCNSPKNYPTGRIYWGMSTIGSASSRLEGVDNDDRILLDYNGKSSNQFFWI